MTDNPWHRRGRIVRYRNPWLEVREDAVTRPDGLLGLYTYVHFRNVAVGVLPLLDDGRVVLVGQWRYTLDAYSWEVPAGGCHHDDAESPIETAHRELEEETGYRAAEMIPLGAGHLSNSISDEVSAMFLARGLSARPGGQRPEPTEELAIRTLTMAELLDEIDRGAITDALTLTTVLRYRLWSRQ